MLRLAVFGLVAAATSATGIEPLYSTPQQLNDGSETYFHDVSHPLFGQHRYSYTVRSSHDNLASVQIVRVRLLQVTDLSEVSAAPSSESAPILSGPTVEALIFARRTPASAAET